MMDGVTRDVDILQGAIETCPARPTPIPVYGMKEISLLETLRP
jgi:hypothetical protein